tara:strand:+ start:387 stop:521 length:135 start_codon:yes stop_codon:yes gene_type:complete
MLRRKVIASSKDQKIEDIETGTSIHPRRYLKSAAKVITNIYTDQ